MCILSSVHQVDIFNQNIHFLPIPNKFVSLANDIGMIKYEAIGKSYI